MPDDSLHALHADTAAVARPGLLEIAAKTVHDAKQLVVDHLELAALEAQRAADGLVRVLIAAIVVTMLVVAAWMAVVASAALWATDAGLSLPWALVLVGVANLIAALALGLWMRSWLPDLMFAATLRQLRDDKETLSDEVGRHA